MRLFVLTGAIAALVLAASLADAQPPGPSTSAGPGRMTCKTAKMCELGIGNPVQLKFEVNVEALTAEDKDRLTKQCTPAGKTPCIVTVQGTEMGDAMKVKAATIKWYN
jgi:hypothetical protein